MRHVLRVTKPFNHWLFENPELTSRHRFTRTWFSHRIEENVCYFQSHYKRTKQSRSKLQKTSSYSIPLGIKRFYSNSNKSESSIEIFIHRRVCFVKNNLILLHIQNGFESFGRKYRKNETLIDKQIYYVFSFVPFIYINPFGYVFDLYHGVAWKWLKPICWIWE